MGQPAAAQGDSVTATDVHIILVPTPTGPVPTPTPGHVFRGLLDGALSPNVRVGGRAAAVLGSTATNTPVHIPIGGTFQIPPTNRATVIAGSATVLINGRPAARAGDTALTCNDPVELPVGTVVVTGVPRVNIG